MNEIPGYDDIIEQRKQQPDYWTVPDMVEGETVQRSYGPFYKKFASANPPRDFTLIPRMIELLKENPRPRTGPIAIAHLENAANEDLPEDVRTEHYDIAGAHIAGPHGTDFSHPAFSLWVRGNGA